MNVIKVPIDSVEAWDKNPRGIRVPDFERLKKQIELLGEYKPLIATKNGRGKYVVLGGNMRLFALRELGRKEVFISVVDAPTDRERLEFALSDNDRAGYYEEEKLAELALENIEGLDVEVFKIDIGESKTVLDVMEEYGPDMKEKPTAVEYPETFESSVDFKFGDYQGRVARDIYDSFVAELNRVRVASGAVLLDDVLRGWLGGSLGEHEKNSSL